MKKMSFVVLAILLAACSDTCVCEGIYASPKLIVPPSMDTRPSAEELAAEKVTYQKAADSKGVKEAAKKD